MHPDNFNKKTKKSIMKFVMKSKCFTRSTNEIRMHVLDMGVVEYFNNYLSSFGGLKRIPFDQIMESFNDIISISYKEKMPSEPEDNYQNRLSDYRLSMCLWTASSFRILLYKCRKRLKRRLKRFFSCLVVKKFYIVSIIAAIICIACGWANVKLFYGDIMSLIP